MSNSILRTFVERRWQESIVEELTRYITIPNKSPAFDRDWSEHGHMEKAVQLLSGWCRKQPIKGMTLEIARLPGRTPLLYFDVPATGKSGNRTILLYGHLDKQPEMSGWREGYGPWEPLFENGKLYGRGSADDGYAVFAALCHAGNLT